MTDLHAFVADDPSMLEANPFHVASNGAASELQTVEPFAGITHAQALAEDVSALPGGQLIEDLVERGTLGTYAGIPETYKSWLAQRTAVAIAQGSGDVLGRPVLEQGPAGYFWQDDSRRNELERIQTFSRVRETPADLALRWFLNEGLRLPDDLARLRATIERFGLVLAVLDSFYNVAGSAAGKDRDAGEIFAALKSEVCDPTGCAVLVVDHAPWPSDSNKGQMRGYGDVHKAAAIRWGVYLLRDRNKLYVEARANNMRGLARTPAVWDPETLELRLLDTEPDGRDIEAEMADYIAEHEAETDRSTNAIAKGIGAGKKRVADALKASDRFTSYDGPNRAKIWVPSNAENHPGNLFDASASVGSPTGSPYVVGNPQGEPEPVVPS